jgi:hypothetical protein
METLETTNVNKDIQAQDNLESEQVMEEKITYGTLPLEDADLRQRAYLAVMNRFWAVKPQHDDFTTQCDKWEQMWKVGTVEKNKDTLANIGSVDVWNAVEDWTAYVMDAVFGVNPPLAVKGKTTKIPDALKDKIVNVLMNNAKETKLEEESEMIIREGIKLGTFSAKTPYQFDEDTRLTLKVKPKTLNIGGVNIPLPIPDKYMAQEIVSEDRPYLKFINIRNLYFRYDKPKVDWIIEEILDNWSNIEKQAKNNNMYGNLEAARNSAYPSSDDSDNELKQGNKVPNSPEAAGNIQKLDGDVMLYEAHNIPITFKEEDNVPDELKGKKILCIVTIANQREVIRIQPTPYKQPPYIITQFWKQPGSILGIGVPQLLDLLVTEFNTRKNQSLDANTLGLYCMVVANSRYIKKKEQLKIRANGVVELKDLPAGSGVRDAIDFIRPPVEYVQVATQMCQNLQAEMVKTSRLKGNIAGEKMSPNPTATEATVIAKEAIKSVKLILNRIDRNIFQEYFTRAYTMMVLNREKQWSIAMNKQVPVINPITGQSEMKKEMEYENISPVDIYTDGIDIEMLGSSHMQDEIVLRHNIMQAMDLAMKFVPGPVINDKGQPVIFNAYKGMNSVLYTMDFEDPEDYWRPAPPPPQPAIPGSVPTPNAGSGVPGAPNINAGAMPPVPADMIKGAVGGAM